MSLVSTLDSEITWLQYGRTYSGVPTACGFTPTWSIPAIPDNQIINLVNRLAAKVRGHQFNAAVNIGEASETVRMVTRTARTLGASFSMLKKGNARAALRYLGVDANRTRIQAVKQDLRYGAGNAWLGLVYGWAPLVSEVGNAAEALASQLRPRVVRFRDRTAVSGTVSSSAPTLISASGKARRSLNVIWKIQEDEQFTTLEEFGFMDPELVAWELMPYSFVVDWFVPIGSFLQARSSLNQLRGTAISSELLSGSATIKSGPIVQILSGSSVRKEVSLVRTVGPISSMPLPRPGLKNPLSLDHMMSALALLQNIFRG